MIKFKAPALFAVSIGSQFFASLLAQNSLVDWNQNWNYMHPNTGVLPTGSGTTAPHPDDTTPWFAGATEFDAGYSGPSFTTGGANFDAGSGVGPLGYGGITYFADGLPAPPEFTAFGTNIEGPPSGQRRTGYFRTTFTVPDDGNFYVNPVIRYIFDDGGFVYLDGELVMRANMVAAAVDSYAQGAAGTANSESQIRRAELSLPEGSTTGGNAVVTPSIAGNATLIKSIERLTPGTHTLAVSVHNSSSTSSDLFMALQLQTEVVDCVITAGASSSTRDFQGTASDPSDDTFAVDLTVALEGEGGAGWVVTGPVGSSLLGQTGAYDVPVNFTGIPLAEFASGTLDLEFADQSDANCTSAVSVVPQRIILSDDLAGTNLPVSTSGIISVPGWTFDDAARTAVMNRPGGDGSRFVMSSALIDLTGQADVQFSGTLQVDDGSTGTEETDEFVAYLIFDGDTENPINLISRHDIITVDGILSADELAPGEGTFNYILDHVIPASVNSAQLVFEGINNSGNETFTVRDLKLSQAAPELQAYNGPAIFNNQGTPNPADDTFSAPLFITSVNLGASTGWTSTDNPNAGLYSDAKPVTFGPFLPFTAPYTVTVTDAFDPSKTASVVLDLALPNIVVTGPTNVTRVENGPGFDDDTLTFDLEITGANGGPGWDLSNGAISPASGDFGVVTFTVPAPLTPGAITFDVADISYSLARQTVTVQVPNRYLIGQSDLSGTLEDVGTNLAIDPAPQWVNDPGERTLTLSNGGTALRTVTSETLDLSTVGEVFFSARLRTTETSTSSNFEPGDRFRAQLIYTIDGSTAAVNLISSLDIGNGGASTTGTLNGANGPANGFLNGYQGAAGTDLADGVTVYATTAEDYAAHADRDEFNPEGLGVEALLNNLFIMSAVIPAVVDDVTLVISGDGVSGGEQFQMSDVTFSTENNFGDTDEDGMTNDYEIANGLNPLDASDRDLDLDGDGRTNLAEFLAGTAANDSSSLLEVTSYTLTDTLGSLIWNSVPGKTYQLEFSTDMNTWSALGGTVSAADAPATETDSGNFPLVTIGNPDKVFFRVRVVN